jgi:hypothetical protein
MDQVAEAAEVRVLVDDRLGLLVHQFNKLMGRRQNGFRQPVPFFAVGYLRIPVFFSAAAYLKTI